MAFGELMKRLGKLAVDNSPTILTALGVTGVVSTAYLTAKATVKSMHDLRINTDGYDAWDDCTPKEKASVIRETGVWKNYMPPVAAGTATILAIISANQIGNRRYAALAAATALSEKAFDDYRTKVKERLGERKEEQVRADVAQDQLKNVVDGQEIHGEPAGELCYDKFSMRCFYGNIQSIKEAENLINHILVNDYYASLADLYAHLGLPAPSWSSEIGWHHDNGLLKIQTSSCLTGDGRPAIAIDYSTEPIRGYHRFRH